MNQLPIINQLFSLKGLLTLVFQVSAVGLCYLIYDLMMFGNNQIFILYESESIHKQPVM